MKLRTVMGTVTIIVIVGGTIYAIKKAKDQEKTEEGAITLDEARSIVAASKPSDQFEEHFTTYFPEDEALKNYIREDAKITARLVADLEEEEEYDESGEEEDRFDDQYEHIMDNIEGPKIDFKDKIHGTINDGNGYYNVETQTEVEGDDGELRYEPSSREARNQFIKMELAEWAPLMDTYQTLRNLFEFPFIPKNDGDYDLKTRIIDYRVQFFGFSSKWAQEVTYADIILYYSRKAEFNCGESVRYWAEYFLDFNEFEINTPSRIIDDLLENLNSHVYFNEERQTFGLFGLTRGSMDQAIKIANRNIDCSVTYEIEFNEFLKSCL